MRWVKAPAQHRASLPPFSELTLPLTPAVGTSTALHLPSRNGCFPCSSLTYGPAEAFLSLARGPSHQEPRADTVYSVATASKSEP